MPMTNVGKIFKPDLRLFATQTVVTALVDQVYGDAGCGHLDRAEVQADAQDGVRVILHSSQAGKHAAILQTALQDAVARLPVKVRVQLQ